MQRNHLDIHPGALRHNVQRIQAWAGNRKIIAVVKADAYGMGLEQCAPILYESGVDLLAVADITEAQRLHTILPQAAILILGCPLPEERAEVVRIGAHVAVSSKAEIKAFAACGSTDQPVPLHLWIDTGMGRMGCLPEEAAGLAQRIQQYTTIRLAGIATHYPDAENHIFCEMQERKFNACLQAIAAPPENMYIHAANSQALHSRPAQNCNAVRVGLLLTGTAHDSTHASELELAICWRSTLSLIKHLPNGHNISYRCTHSLSKACTIGIIPIGYADGYPTALSDRASVLIRGTRCPILGEITMDYIIVDISSLPDANVGDSVVLIGQQDFQHSSQQNMANKSDCIRVEDLAKLAHCMPYEILCGLHKRYRQSQ